MIPAHNLTWIKRDNQSVAQVTKICRVSWKNRPILSTKIEHVPSSTILSADFSYIGQQILFMLPWWLFTMEDEYLFYLFIVFVIIFIH